MLTLKRFKALTDSYGAEPKRWPETMRADAEALLRVSPEARRMLAVAAGLDEAINGAGTHEDAWPQGEEEAALSRLRARVTARLAASASHSAAVSEAVRGDIVATHATAAGEHVRRAERRESVAAPRRLRWLRDGVSPVAQWSTSARVAGMAAAGGLIVVAGLLLGSMDAAGPTAQVDVLAMLQPNPLPFLADQ